MANIVISGSGLFTPELSVTNDELVAAYNKYVDVFNQENQQQIEAGTMEPMAYSSSEFIEKASGIKSRYVLYKPGIVDEHRLKPQFSKRMPGEKPEMIDMALEAAKEALAQANRDIADIDLIICASANNQRPYPAISIELQHYLGAKGFAYDMNVACSSATFGIINAANAIQSGSAKVVLMVNPEFSTPQVNFRDRDTHFIFGDVCTAAVIELEEGCQSDNAFRLTGTKQITQFSNNIRCDMNYSDHCCDNVSDNTPFFKQQGRKVFKELLPIVINTIETHLAEMQVSASELKRMWLHQANINMNTFAAKKLLGRDPAFEEAPIVLDEYANTASAGSLIAFHKYKDDFKKGDRGLLCSFGAGYSVGSIGLQKI